MKKNSRMDLIKPLEREGLRFSELVLVSEGEYAASDADWNYKDIPHLHIVHELAESFPAVIGDDIICSINMQKILGFWFPVALVNYEYAPYRQIYYTTLLFFAIIIETRIDEIAPLRTQVTTTYSIGSPKFLFWMMPILKALIRHNYKNLMSTDIPMRDRRGALRKLGYTIQRKGDTYTFPETTNITDTNLIPPAGKDRVVQCNYVSLLENTNEALVGDTGLLGFRLLRKGDEVMILPRSCPHEGACVEKSDFSTGAVRCPWHGRRLLPIGTFTWKQNTSFGNATHDVRVEGDMLSVAYIGQATARYAEAAA